MKQESHSSVRTAYVLAGLIGLSFGWSAVARAQVSFQEFTESIGEKNSPMQEGFFEKAKRFFDL